MSNIQGLPPLPQCFDGLITVERTVSETSQGDIHEGISHALNLNESAMKNTEDTESAFMEDGTNKQSPEKQGSSTRIHTALQRLRSEMAGLRKLDVSLLYQLWNLHEAIQDYKNVMQDRYSDIGSEYSYGTMGSRASSITSIDSCDLDDFHTCSDPSIINSLQGSTTSLIQQIEELKVRAETEF